MAVAYYDESMNQRLLQSATHVIPTLRATSEGISEVDMRILNLGVAGKDCPAYR